MGSEDAVCAAPQQHRRGAQVNQGVDQVNGRRLVLLRALGGGCIHFGVEAGEGLGGSSTIDTNDARFAMQQLPRR
jgi:hypothetical protein